MLVEYDGTRYHGFQWQAGLPTIQDELEQAIRRVCGQSGRVMAASRTDAGVHARGQVAGFRAKSTLDIMTLVRALNHYLPEDIAVKAAYRAGDDFDVRRDALSREYHYRILNSSTRSPLDRAFSLFVPRKLDTGAMNEACRLIAGEHDFASFASSLEAGKSTRRNVHEAGVETKGDFIIFRVVANSFLPHQVRSTVGMLIRLGLGQLGMDEFRDIMEARSLGLAGPVSPACGLCLMKVNYAGALGNWTGS
ncbi:MAG: tRNA pseudouridine(38-40) synthase TruA [Dehalococcoidia bacterium]|nr:tRNA pseudouridine(38-40) synthase TruA [Dehalococcoidia bacterium]